MSQYSFIKQGERRGHLFQILADWRGTYSKGALISGEALIDHFTVVGLVTWPLNGSEAGVDLVLIQTSLLLLCKSSCSYAN